MSNKINQDLLQGNTKHCPVCKTFKSFDSFYTRKSRAVGLSSWCKDCARPIGKERARRPEVIAKHYKNHLRRRYKLTHEELESMKVLQNNECGICKTSFDVTDPHIDHNHTSGLVRGLLCGSCNRGIGLLKDSPDILLSAAKYLQCSSN